MLRRLVVGSGILVLGLTGCTAPVVAPGTGSPSPTAASPPPIAAPGSRVPLECDEVLSPEGLATLVGHPVETAAEPRGVAQAAMDGAGLSTCRWGSPESIQVSVVILVSADEEDVRELRARPVQPPFTADSIVPGSGLLCDVLDGSVSCHYTFPTERFAAEGWIAFHDPAASADDVTAVVAKLLRQAATVLGSVEPRPAWSAPERATADFLDCRPLGADGAVADALGWAGAIGPVFDGSGDFAWLVSRAWTRGGFGECTWRKADGGSSLLLNYAAGASWAWEQGPPVEGDPVTVEGATSAVGRCEEYTCAIDAIVGESWVRVQVGRQDGSGIPEATRALEAVVPLLPIVPAPA